MPYYQKVIVILIIKAITWFWLKSTAVLIYRLLAEFDRKRFFVCLWFILFSSIIVSTNEAKCCPSCVHTVPTSATFPVCFVLDHIWDQQWHLLAAVSLNQIRVQLASAAGGETACQRIPAQMKVGRWKGLLTPVLQIRSTCRRRRYDNYDNINCYSACLPLRVFESSMRSDHFQTWSLTCRWA